MKTVQVMLVHSSYKLTADMYTSVLPQLEPEAADALVLRKVAQQGEQADGRQPRGPRAVPGVEDVAAGAKGSRAGDRDRVGRMSGDQFTIGDHALEIEPIRQQGGSRPADSDEPGTYASLQVYANDIGLSLNTIGAYRFTASRWPMDQRRDGVSFKIHQILA